MYAFLQFFGEGYISLCTPSYITKHISANTVVFTVLLDLFYAIKMLLIHYFYSGFLLSNIKEEQK